MKKPAYLGLVFAALLVVVGLIGMPLAQGQEEGLSPLQGTGVVTGTLVFEPYVLVRIPADLPAVVRKNAQFSMLRDGFIPQELRDEIYMEYGERECADPATGISTTFEFDANAPINGIRTDGERNVIGQTLSTASGWTYCPVESVGSAGPTTVTPPSAVLGTYVPEPGLMGESIEGTYCGGYRQDLLPEGLDPICVNTLDQPSGGTATGTYATTRLWITYAKICGPPANIGFGLSCKEYGSQFGGAIPLTVRAQLTFAEGPSGFPVADVGEEGLLVKKFLYTGVFQYGPTMVHPAA